MCWFVFVGCWIFERGTGDRPWERAGVVGWGGTLKRWENGRRAAVVVWLGWWGEKREREGE